MVYIGQETVELACRCISCGGRDAPLGDSIAVGRVASRPTRSALFRDTCLSLRAGSCIAGAGSPWFAIIYLPPLERHTHGA